MFNWNKDTGLVYGVVSARNAPWLEEDIITHGNNTSFERFRTECRDKVRNLVRDLPVASAEIEAAVDASMETLEDYYLYEGEEDNYTYVDGPTKYELGWLGGAPLIWVVDSEWACYCNHCSPCVPGAGDLDNPEGTTLAHCMPPERWKEVYENGGEIPKTLIHLPTEDGFDLWGFCGKPN
jgi:hypothetical protein